MALITQWNSLSEVGATAPASADKWNDFQENLLYLFDRKADEVVHTDGADWTTTSTVPVKVDSSRYRVQIDTETGNLMIAYNFHSYTVGSGYNYMGVLIDDDYLYGDVEGGNESKILQAMYQRDVNAQVKPIVGVIPILGLDVGVHEFEPMWWVNTGTGGIHQSGDYVNYFKVWEF